MAADFLYLNSRDYLLRLDINQIIYFEADGNYTYIISANKVKHTISMTLAKMHEILIKSLGEKSLMFARIGKSHIISMNYINQIDIPKHILVLSDGHSFTFKLMVSKDALRMLKNKLIKQNSNITC